MKPDLTISIVIITYNRPADMLDLVKNIAWLEEAEQLESIIIVNNRSTESYEALEVFIKTNPHLPFRYYVAPENLGVSRGRNDALQKSSADILVFLDDDALFANNDALKQIKSIFSEDTINERELGIASFKVYYYDTGELQQTAFPHKQFEKRKHLHHFDTAYFVGCAHAIRRTVFDHTGLYPDNFFYGMEEYDLSYRTLNAGFSIAYDDRVVIRHKESPAGRLPNREKLRGMWVNKSKVAWKYLPGRYFFSTALLWSFEYLKKSGWDFSGWVKGWRKVVRIPREERRARVDSACMRYLRRVQARLWY
jgi:GT2 family glycosyltransferase